MTISLSLQDLWCKNKDKNYQKNINERIKLGINIMNKGINLVSMWVKGSSWDHANEWDQLGI
jgi:hypothetical protein